MDFPSNQHEVRSWTTACTAWSSDLLGSPPVAPSQPSTPAALPAPSAHVQLYELFQDTQLLKVFELAARDVMRVWGMRREAARCIVMSAVGEPRALAAIHRAWFSSKTSGRGLTKVIVRRRVIDLLRCDARRPRHDSLPAPRDEHPCDVSQLEDAGHDPRELAELRQGARMVRAALKSFAARGPIQARQAELVKRYALDEHAYPELTAELGCSTNALRVRLHKAMRALRKHIDEHHRELGDLLEHAPRAS